MPLYSVETYGELQPHLQEEWLVTNGLGGFACGTLVGCNTRRYHGLLCAATMPPVGRVMLLNRIGEMLRVDGNPDLFEFSINQFGIGFHPRGDQYLQRFVLDEAVARWEYNIDRIRIIKEVQMPWLTNAAGIRYTIETDGRLVELSLLPFVRLLDFHALRRGKSTFEESHGPRNCFVKDAAGQVLIESDAGAYEPAPDWWMGHTYAVETERGLDDTEDLYTPGKFVFSTKANASITLWASLPPGRKFDWDQAIAKRKQAVSEGRRHPMNVTAPADGGALQHVWEKPSQNVRRLAHAANDFIVYRKSPDGKDGSSVIAGYPWFSDWGRDTMIALPGLLLATGRFEQARQVLTVFAQYVSEGMIPNRFDDYTNEPSYNTVDASLWFIHACFEYARLSGDTSTLETVLQPACRAIIKGYSAGTRFNIKVDPADGLVCQGDSSTQLTWMDAKCDGVCFTPRQGKPVEINALWYHALMLMGDQAQAKRVGESFVKAFWLSPFRGLADVLDGSRRDASIRPNQIFAVSLRHSPLSADQQRAVVETVRRELLTPVGLRTLSRTDPKYHGVYRGSPRQRDEAYHNGTVWPWPMGAFLEAYLRVHERSRESIEQAKRWLEPLLETMQHACIGQISEIFDGDEPHRPVGCFAQAWSVAEALRLAIELGM